MTAQDIQSELDIPAQEAEAARVVFAGPCDFVAGVDSMPRLIPATLPEIAFAGRSNVGKSSLINALTGRKTLARTSHTPGRTQQLNFFSLSDRFFLVDMPGYGYAKVSKSKRSSWDDLIFDYLRGRQTLRCVFILVDSRHGLKDSDEGMMDMLDEAAVPYRIVLTKADKATGAMLSDARSRIQESLRRHSAGYPDIHVTSAETGDGIAVLRAIMLRMACR